VARELLNPSYVDLGFLRSRIIGLNDMVLGDDCSKVLSPREREVAHLVGAVCQIRKSLGNCG
jgi:hypothetical protein